VLNVVTESEYTFPSRHRIRADNWVDGFEHIANVLGCASRFGVEFETIFISSFFEAWLRISGCEGFEKFLEGG
jgi:hypothetical protein